MAGDMDRDDAFTDDVVRQAARARGIDPEPILTMMKARTLDGPVRDGWERDLLTDALEEFADAPNYISWDLLKAIRQGAPGVPAATVHYMAAVGAAVYAFDQLRLAREVLWESCNRCGGSLYPTEGEFIPVLNCRQCGRTVPR